MVVKRLQIRVQKWENSWPLMESFQNLQQQRIVAVVALSIEPRRLWLKKLFSSAASFSLSSTVGMSGAILRNLTDSCKEVKCTGSNNILPMGTLKHSPRAGPKKGHHDLLE